MDWLSDQQYREAVWQYRLGGEMKRRQSVPHTFSENIAAEKARIEAELANMKPGVEADALLRKLRQLDTTARLGDWLSSPGLQPPRRD
jgi:hypothetical protein